MENSKKPQIGSRSKSFNDILRFWESEHGPLEEQSGKPETLDRKHLESPEVSDLTEILESELPAIQIDSESSDENSEKTQTRPTSPIEATIQPSEDEISLEPESPSLPPSPPEFDLVRYLLSSDLMKMVKKETQDEYADKKKKYDKRPVSPKKFKEKQTIEQKLPKESVVDEYVTMKSYEPEFKSGYEGFNEMFIKQFERRLKPQNPYVKDQEKESDVPSVRHKPHKKQEISEYEREYETPEKRFGKSRFDETRKLFEEKLLQQKSCITSEPQFQPMVGRVNKLVAKFNSIQLNYNFAEKKHIS